MAFSTQTFDQFNCINTPDAGMASPPQHFIVMNIEDRLRSATVYPAYVRHRCRNHPAKLTGLPRDRLGFFA